ncbi:MAG: hypothetical protein V2B18_22400, partial [Pseudomonadota bacterium]
GELDKKMESSVKKASRSEQDVAEEKKRIKAQTKAVETVQKELTDLRKDVLDHNTKLANAVKKALPKVKIAAVAEIKDMITPLEQKVTALKADVESGHKTLEDIKSRPAGGSAPTVPAAPATAGEDVGKNIRAIHKRIQELEDILASHKAFLLEVGSKVHDIETSLKRRGQG